MPLVNEATNDKRIEWQNRHLQWLLSRISGSSEDKQQFLDMWFLAMNERHAEGIDDAKHVVVMVHDEFPCGQTRVIVKALTDLAELNRKT